MSNLVYLRTTPEVVYDRMKVRGRSEETSVSLDYLKQLHDLHEEWLIHGRKYRPAPVIDTIFFHLHFILIIYSNDCFIIIFKMFPYPIMNDLRIKIIYFNIDLGIGVECRFGYGQNL